MKPATLHLWINGQRVPSQGSRMGEVLNPATGEVIRVVPLAGRNDVDAAVAAVPEAERAALAEELLASLAQPDAELDKLWLAEAEDRLAAYRAGELAAVDAEEVFAELGRAI